MKTAYLVLIFGFLSCYAQEDKKSHVHIAFGSPYHTDMDVRKNSFSVSIGYQRRFAKSFGWEAFLTRASSNSTLGFFDSRERLEEFVSKPENNVTIGSNWSRIRTFAFGGKIHFSFIDNSRHYLSFAGGGGLYTSKSERQFFLETSTNSEGVITDFVSDTAKATKTEFFLMPSLQYYYIFKNGITLGVGVSTLLDQDSEILLTQPVIANYYNLALSFGKKF